MAHPTEASPTTSARPTSARPAAARPPSSPSAPPAAGRRLGSRVALIVFYGAVGAFSVGATVQITRQVFYAGEGPAPYASCGEGLRALVGGIERARHEASGMEGEQGALTRFRSALRPEWDHHEAVAATCQGTRPDKRALDAIERLRYAEEHAVRREAGDLAPLRRRVQILVETQLAASREPQ